MLYPAGYFDFTIKNYEARKQREIIRRKIKESNYWNKSGIDALSFWFFFYYGIFQY